MLLTGLIPNVLSARSVKRVLRELGPCPECGGQGWVCAKGYGRDSPPEQEQCGTCQHEDDLFWRDGVEYYLTKGSTALDTINAMRHERGLPVCYGFWKMKMNRDGYFLR